MARPISDSLNSHHCRAIISAADGDEVDGNDDGVNEAGISSMSHQTHEEECLESTSRCMLYRDHRIA